MTPETRASSEPAAAPVHAPRLAINPIAYWFSNGKVDKSRAVFEVAFGHLRELGYAAVKADVPAGMPPAEYLAWIGSYGLGPSVSLFSSALDETVDIAAELPRAAAFAAQQAALGLDRAMVSSVMIRARMAAPGIGADYRDDRFDLCIENLGRVCEVFRTEGIHAVLHNHIGGVFETADEIDRALASIDPTLLGFGPDTGHLAWAGADPADVIARHADRVGAIHLKDAFADFLDPASRVGMSYLATQATKRLWAEPGHGVVDFDRIIAAMPVGYDGDWMIEVDEPSIDDLFESTRRCRDWAVRSLPSGSLRSVSTHHDAVHADG